jgi:hypothetical protein
VIVGQEPTNKPITVMNQKSFSTDKIDCERIPLGETRFDEEGAGAHGGCSATAVSPL